MEEFTANEHAFQAYKEFVATHGSRKGYELIRLADSPGKAKNMGRQVNFTNDDRIRWDLFVAPVRMFEVCVAKFVQNKECHEWLRATGRRLLVEHRKDPIWGDNLDGTGKNMLGKTLMLVRTHLWGI